MRVKENSNIFQLLIHQLDNTYPALPSSFLDHLARDLISLFFADFASPETSIITLLRHLEILIKNTFTSFCNGEQSMPFGDEGLMVNRIIKTFINSNENKNYLNLLFGKLFFEVKDLKDYIKKKKASINENINKEVPTSSKQIITPKIMDGYFNLKSINNNHSKAINQKEQTITQRASIKEDESEELSTSSILILNETILKRIIKKLAYMPLSMRYFCKLLEQIAIQQVIPHYNNRIIISLLLRWLYVKYCLISGGLQH